VSQVVIHVVLFSLTIVLLSQELIEE